MDQAERDTNSYYLWEHTDCAVIPLEENRLKMMDQAERDTNSYYLWEHTDCAVIPLEENRLKMMDQAERDTNSYYLWEHTDCAVILLEENRLNMMDQAERDTNVLLVRTHRHYAVILLEMMDGAERKRHWQWQLLLFIRQIRGTWRDRWPTCRETQQIHRAERKRHWPVLLVRSERLVETDDRLADAQGRKKETLTIIVGEIRQTGRNRWETHRYIGQERDTDHYCWWDYRDWKRQMTDLQRDSQNT